MDGQTARISLNISEYDKNDNIWTGDGYGKLKVKAGKTVRKTQKPTEAK